MVKGVREANRSAVVVERNGPIAIVRFDRKASLNALRQQDLLDLTAAARSFHDDLETRVVVLTGAPTAFSAGIDLKDPGLWDVSDRPLAEQRHIMYRGARLTEAWENIPQFTITAIEGLAVGGAIALALATDFRVIGRGAYLYVPEAKIGINLGWGTVPRLVSLIGPARAKRVILLCEKLEARDALDWGLVDELADDGAAERRALEIAAIVAELPPHVVRATKQAVTLTSSALHRVSSFMDADQASLFAADVAARDARKAFAASGRKAPKSSGARRR
jgi:enoyl-CoA hydratase